MIERCLLLLGQPACAGTAALVGHVDGDGWLAKRRLSRGQPGQRGKIRTVADRGPSPCMVGTAELPGYLSS